MEIPTASNLLAKIRRVTRSIVESLSQGRSPEIAMDLFQIYCSDPKANCCCSSNLSKGKMFITLQKECHVRRMDVLLRVLLIVQKLLQENKQVSKGEIYYMSQDVFEEPSDVDDAINDVCILLQCSCHNLNIGSAYKGLVMGSLRFKVPPEKYDCMDDHLNTPRHVPMHVEAVEDIESDAQYILVVEKDTVFQRLANDKFCGTDNKCIVITGKGYPDTLTRRFLCLLVEKLKLPTYCLVDCDPYGFDILTTYRFGSNNMAYNAKFLCVSKIHWLGVFLSDSEEYQVLECSLIPLKDKGLASDKKKAKDILRRCYLQQENGWRLELEKMLKSGVKFEIEALYAGSLSVLAEACIPSKIRSMTIQNPR